MCTIISNPHRPHHRIVTPDKFVILFFKQPCRRSAVAYTPKNLATNTNTSQTTITAHICYSLRVHNGTSILLPILYTNVGVSNLLCMHIRIIILQYLFSIYGGWLQKRGVGDCIVFHIHTLYIVEDDMCRVCAQRSKHCSDKFIAYMCEELIFIPYTNKHTAASQPHTHIYINVCVHISHICMYITGHKLIKYDEQHDIHFFQPPSPPSLCASCLREIKRLRHLYDAYKYINFHSVASLTKAMFCILPYLFVVIFSLHARDRVAAVF